MDTVSLYTIPSELMGNILLENSLTTQTYDIYYAQFKSLDDPRFAEIGQH